MINNKTKAPLILEIKGNSLDDGPGIRSVIFFKGCPLSCVWCHNPESKKAVEEISFDAKTCVNCGECRTICPENAFSPENRFYIERNKCTLCFLCLDACPSGALEKVGKKMSVDEILKKILPDKPFFNTSGGGVTLSGGEPALYMEYTSKLLKALKQENLHTLIETCGVFDLEKFMNDLYPHLDTIYFDIKIFDSKNHKKYCGLPNDKILYNFKKLYKTVIKDNKRLLPRTPLIPGITDSEENLRNIANFLKKLKIDEAVLLEYNPLWHEKNDKVGIDDPYRKNKAMNAFLKHDVLNRSKTIFSDMGIKC